MKSSSMKLWSESSIILMLETSFNRSLNMPLITFSSLKKRFANNEFVELVIAHNLTEAKKLQDIAA